MVDSIRQEFGAYFPPANSELKTILASGIVVPDANVLLSLYRYSPSTRDDIQRAFDRIRANLWVPHQVMLEFLRRRDRVIAEQKNGYNKLSDELSAKVRDLCHMLDAYGKFAHIDEIKLKNLFETALESAQQNISKWRDAHPDYQGPDEALLAKVIHWFDGRVGAPFSPEQRSALEAEGEERYKRKTPPGYKDSKKTDEDSDIYGDLVIWKQIIEKAKTDQKDVVFVTDDQKEDWWRIESGERRGPRPELINELKETAGRRLWIYSAIRFMERITEVYPEGAKTETLAEMREVRNARLVLRKPTSVLGHTAFIAGLLSGLEGSDDPVLMKQTEQIAKYLSQVVNGADLVGRDIEHIKSQYDWASLRERFRELELRNDQIMLPLLDQSDNEQ